MWRCSRLLAVLVLTIVAVTALGAPHAAACSCAETDFVGVADDYDIAFVGRQIERRVDDEVADNGAALVFEVDEVYLGDVTNPFTVRTHAQNSACGLDLGNAGTVALAARTWRGAPSVGLCGSVVATADLRDAYGEPSAPSAPSAVTEPPTGSSATSADEGATGSSAVTEPPTGSSATSADDGTTGSSDRVARLGTGALLLVIVGAAALWLWRGRTPATPPSSRTSRRSRSSTRS